jgi:two-component system, chemotaxis family, chemotaxis protein CheY
MTRRILVIDDDPVILMTITAILEDYDYDIVTADNGVSGLERFRAVRPDLVITDIVMPKMEGLQMIKELRAEWPEARIIATSAGSRVGRHGFLDIARQLGAWEVLVKPFDPQELVDCVRSCLGS